MEELSIDSQIRILDMRERDIAGEMNYAIITTPVCAAVGAICGAIGGAIKYYFTGDPSDVMQGVAFGGPIGAIFGVFGATPIYDSDLKKIREERAELIKSVPGEPIPVDYGNNSDIVN